MNVREIAYASLLEICKDNGYSNIIVSKAIRSRQFNDRDRRFYTELVYGTVRTLNYLDWIIGKLSTRRISKLDPVCLVILCMGLYQIFGMSKIPQSAACNESVKLAIKFGNRGMSKFVNGILRNAIRRSKEFVIPSMEEDVEQHLSLTYHQQPWLIKKWIGQYGIDATLKLCQYFDSIPLLCLRTNTAVISRDDLMEQMKKEGWSVRKADHAPEGIYVENNLGIHRLTALKKGYAIIQDEPSQLVAHIVDPRPGETIFDVCAAPGGKTTHLAALGGPTCAVYGADIYQHKLRLIDENAKSLGLNNIHPILQDGTEIGHAFPERADRVLVDAPCSGLGVLRHKIDLRWRKNKKDIAALPDLQLRILESAAACVRPGGVLVYSTCTMNESENDAVVHQFLASHHGFTIENIGSACGFSKEGPCLQLLPQNDGLDGFFIARMRKESRDD